MAVALLPALGFPRTWPLLTVLWGAAVVAYGADALLSPRRTAVSWDLQTPATLYIGERAVAVATVRVSSRRPVPVELVLDLSEELEPQPSVVGMGSAPGSTFDWELVPRRRGTVEIERLWIRYLSPLGLWSWLVVAPIGREIAVLPNLPLVRSTALRFFSDRDFRAGLKIERYRGDGTEFDSLKEFLVGDDSRTIDWKSSARHRKLYCRQHRAERNHQIVITLDTGRLMSEHFGDVPKLDHALNAALVLSYVCLTSGDRVGLFSFGSGIGPGLDPVRGVASIQALIHATSRIDYSNDETNFTLGLTTLAQKLRRRSLIILLTDFVDTVTAELMLENMDRIRRRHLVVFASVRDPLLAETVASKPSSVVALNRCVVAQNLLRDREIVHRRLRRMGIHPLDAEPSAIGPGLINQYLDIKRRELV